MTPTLARMEKLHSNLYCPSCGRKEGSGPDDVRPVTYIGLKWCTFCTAIGHNDGRAYVNQPSPGRMVEGPTNDPLAAWEDCYSTTLKKRISKEKAKAEIQRAWAIWDGDKSNNMAMLTFFFWLQRFRPYFLTFRGHGDPWQTVHGWLDQYEREKN